MELEPGLPMVVVGRDSVTLDGKAVVSLSNGAIPPTELHGGEGGWLLTRLDKAMRKRGHALAKGSNLPPFEQYYERITIAPDGRTTSDVLHKVLDSVRNGGFMQQQFLVVDAAGEHRALRTCFTRCCRRLSPPCWGVPQPPPVDILLGGETAVDMEEILRSDKGPSKAPREVRANPPTKSPSDEEGDQNLNLMVTVTADGIGLHATGETLPEGCSVRSTPIGERRTPALPRRADGAFDFVSLERCFNRIHSAHTDETAVIVSTNSSIEWNTIVRVIDLARGEKARPMFDKFLLTTGVE